MKAGLIAAAIESFAPLDIQEEWDNSGFCIGGPDSEVTSVLVGFDCTPELLEEAAETGADMVITHHPLIFSGLKKISSSDYVGRAVMTAIKNGITVYACHTNMDKVPGGVSGTLASVLGLCDVEILDKDTDGYGLGVIGTLPSPETCTSFLENLKSKLGVAALRHSSPTDRPVSRVAACGGSGHSFIHVAAAAGADVYLTGDISYHDFYAPDGMMIVDIGHFEGERMITDVICRLVMEKFPNFAVRIGKRVVNPVHYF